MLTLQRPENLWRGITLTLLAIPYFGLCALSYELIQAGWTEALWIVYIITGLCGLAFLANGLVCAIRLVPYYLIHKPRARQLAAEQAALMADTETSRKSPERSFREPSHQSEDAGPPCSQCGAATRPEPLAAENEVHTAYVCPVHGVDSVDMRSSNPRGYERDQPESK